MEVPKSATVCGSITIPTAAIHVSRVTGAKTKGTLSSLFDPSNCCILHYLSISLYSVDMSSLKKYTPAVLEDMQVPELKDLCRSHGISGFSALTKSELIKLITRERKKERVKDNVDKDDLDLLMENPKKKFVSASRSEMTCSSEKLSFFFLYVPNAEFLQKVEQDRESIADARKELEEAEFRLLKRRKELETSLAKVVQAEEELKKKREKLKKAESKKKLFVKKFIWVEQPFGW